MASLLEKAKNIRKHLKEQEEFDSIPESERQELQKELDKAISRNRLEINEDTFEFEPTKNDIKLPVIFNAAAIVLTIGVSLFFLFYFNQAESVLVTEKEVVEAAESRLIQAIKEESEQRLGQKEKEIASINDSLENMRLQQERLAQDYREQAGQLEAELRQTLEETLKAERLKLQEEGLSEIEIERELKNLESEKNQELTDELVLLNDRLEAEKKQKEESLNTLILENEENLKKASAERVALEGELAEQQALLDQQQQELTLQQTEKEQLIKDRDSSISELARLSDLKEREDLIISRIFSRYSSINELISRRDYIQALEELKNLEDFINQDAISGLPAVQFRQNTDLIMIESLKRLIEIESQPQEEESSDSDEQEQISQEFAEELERQKTEYEELLKDRDSTASELARLNELKESEDRIIKGIFSRYNTVRESINNQNYSAATKELDSLELYIQTEDIARIPAVQSRSDTDLLMIQSLKKLIEIESRPLEEQKPDESDIISEKFAEQLKQQQADYEELLEDRDTTASELARLNELKEEEDRIISSILYRYSTVNSFISNRNFTEALSELDSLESYLNQREIALLPAVQFRQNTDLIMIQSLRRLIEMEDQPEETLAESSESGEAEISESELLLMEVARIVEEGNDLYNQGDINKARENYLEALSQIPSLETGFSRLQNIEDSQEEEERAQFVQSLDEGERLYNSRDFDSAVIKYREALKYLESDSDIVDRIVTQLMDSRLAIEESEGNTLISSDELSLLNQAKIQQEEKEEILKKLDTLENSYSRTGDKDSDDEQNEEELYSLISTKLLVKEVLASEPIKEQYSDLYEKMEIYLDAYGKEKEQEGRDAALAEIVRITEQLTESNGSSPTTGEALEQQELFLQFLENLKDIMELGD